jgi:archaellum component FlaF (FlaF/FlaG flagellin family)
MIVCAYLVRYERGSPILHNKDRLFNKRRGVATMLGILIMVGILITSIIPMFMYVNEVNNYYDKTVVEMKIADDERSREDLEVYAYGANQTAISVWLKNKGAVSVNITHIRVMRADLQKVIIFNSTNRPENFTLQISASAQETIVGLDLTPVLNLTDEKPNKFNIYVATNRGNSFASETNTLSQSGSGWETSVMEFLINIMIHSTSTEDFQFKVYNTTGGSPVFITEKEIENVHGTDYTMVNVPMDGIYNVTCYRRQGSEYSDFVDEKFRTLTWSHPVTWMEFYYPPP